MAASPSPVKLTDVNPQAKDFALGATEVVTWKSRDGLEVEGVLLKPVGYDPAKRYPLLVVAHGGPAGAHLDNYRVGGLEGGQLWAGQGWAVFYPNPRGSSNYGEKFLRANVADWGGGDFPDIMTRRRRADRARHRRPGQAGAHRLELRRLHDRLDDHADHALQGGDGRRRADQHVEHVRHQRHPQRAHRLLRRHRQQGDAAALHEPLGDDPHRQRRPRRR